MQDKEIEKEIHEIFKKEDKEFTIGGFPISDFYIKEEDNWVEISPRKRKNRYISKTTRYKVLNRQHWRCNVCYCKLRYSSNHSYSGYVAHIDHIFPWVDREEYDGDIDDIGNLQALCPSCNLKKGKKNGQRMYRVE